MGGDQGVRRLSPEGEREIAAMNARVYAMSPEDRERWFAEHPVSDFTDPDTCDDNEPQGH
jgi:hypothetical protein